MEQKISLLKKIKAQHLHPKIIDAFCSVPRENFIGKYYKKLAYMDCALPIECDQTISQPSLVLKMLDLIYNPHHAKKVLEVGTGSGYQTALLSKIFKTVYSIERIEYLLLQAEKKLELIDCKNIYLLHQNGQQGWEAHAPYDAIILSAAIQDIDDQLLAQLKIGGKLIAPIQAGHYSQTITLYHKKKSGIKMSQHGDVEFVPILPGIDSIL